MLPRPSSLLAWLLSLFDPPPLETMNWAQKVARVFVVTVTLLLSCVLLSMLSSLIIFIVQRGWQMLHGGSHLLAGLVIILAGISVNVVCVMILVEISRADAKLIGSAGDDDCSRPEAPR
jgi:hypothetical protein